MGKGERDKNEVETGINLIKQHLTYLMKRLNFILNVLGETAFSTEACPGLMLAGMYEYHCPLVHDSLIGILAMLVIQDSEEYFGCEVIIFEDQQVCGELRENACNLEPLRILGACEVGKDPYKPEVHQQEDRYMQSSRDLGGGPQLLSSGASQLRSCLEGTGEWERPDTLPFPGGLGATLCPASPIFSLGGWEGLSASSSCLATCLLLAKTPW